MVGKKYENQNYTTILKAQFYFNTKPALRKRIYLLGPWPNWGIVSAIMYELKDFMPW